MAKVQATNYTELGMVYELITTMKTTRGPDRRSEVTKVTKVLPSWNDWILLRIVFFPSR